MFNDTHQYSLLPNYNIGNSDLKSSSNTPLTGSENEIDSRFHGNEMEHENFRNRGDDISSKLGFEFGQAGGETRICTQPILNP
ncbi:MAG: hypothetical protein KAT85_08310, partial [candidate division Zixibacteria bacterium]|nr:hypothetical protein [candidate division Zixibacteria bacterium]